MRETPTFGPYAVLWALAWTLLAISKLNSPADSALLLLIAVLVPIGFVLHIWNTGHHGLTPLELARVAFWPPEWWGMWWPRALRRPADLWRRLPWPARVVRIVLSAFIVVLPGMILLRQRLEPSDGSVASEWFIAMEAVLLLGTATALGTALWWGARQGLSWGESVRVLFGATMPSEGWRQPHVARLLAPPAGGVRPPERDSPSDHRRAIAELAVVLPATAADLRVEAEQAARLLFAAIQACDTEIVSLARVASASELDRLTAQLTDIEETQTRRSAERLELKALLSRQIALVRHMRDRSEEISQQRSYLLNLMHGLWAQLARVRDMAAEELGAPQAALNRAKALLAEITAALAASDVEAPNSR